jgi:recombination protein RecA
MGRPKKNKAEDSSELSEKDEANIKILEKAVRKEEAEAGVVADEAETPKAEATVEPKVEAKVAAKAKVKPKADPKMDDHRKALNKIVSAAEKLFGEGAIFRGGDGAQMNIEAISTGSLSLDSAIGVGGMPKGRIIEISGLEASGKTMISLSTIAEVQRKGGVAAFIDVEHALTPKWCKSLGVDYDNMLITQPDSGEKALTIMKFLIEKAKVDIVVLDSVAALVTEREIEGEMGKAHMAPTARLMSAALKNLTPIVSESKTCCIFINQIRENIGGYGNPEITPGGKALKFYSSVRLKVGKVSQGAIKKGQLQIGHRVKIKVMKNKVAPPFSEAEFDLYYLKGIDGISELAELASKYKIVERPNNRTYIYGEEKWTSAAAFGEAIVTRPELAKEFKEKIQAAMLLDEDEPAALIEQDGMLLDASTGEIVDEVVNDASELE